MEVAEVDDRYRITIPKEVRETFKVAKGQRFFLVPHGDDLLLKPIPADPASRLDKLVGDFQFDRGSRRRAEEWLLKQGRR
ncbi:MAG TPA: AbrB/MazE/SpoVT family DNA-binding domain-containing protein [Nitrososphaerales archaeon]|nr:AbrB/MazE/SpoVT family DNA-binding domain-containing protein [Nitrososphaerales archaeon]